MAAKKAQFITFEGGEGSGKSTQLKHAAAWLHDRSVDVLTTREPGGAEGAEMIRRLLVEGATDRWEAITEVLLHAAARTEHLAKTVRPALEAGTWVLSDRFVDSTRAYQGFGHGVDLGVIDAVHRESTGGLTPDLTLIFDVPVKTGLGRAKGRANGRTDIEDRYERMGVAFHERVRAGFLSIAEDAPGRCRVIDASDDENTVREAAIAAIAAHIGPSGWGGRDE